MYASAHFVCMCAFAYVYIKSMYMRKEETWISGPYDLPDLII